MKCWTPFFVLSLLYTAAFAAYSNQELQNLLRAKGKSGVIPLNDANYEKVLKGRRDYHLIIFLTSQTPQVNCVLCREFTPHYDIVANSYMRTYPDGFAEDRQNVYFLTAEISDSRKFFKALKLDSIPKIYHLPPTKPDAKSNSLIGEHRLYEFFQGDHTLMFSQWVNANTGHSINIYIPPDYSRMALNAIATFLVVLALKKYRSQAFAIFKSPILWGLLSIVFVLLFLAGQMFNQIRGTPYVNEKGNKVEYIAPTAQMQYGLETQVVSTLYGLTGLSFVVLVARVSKINNAKVQFFASVIVCAALYILYGIFLNIFGLKYSGYPFRFFHYLGF